MLISVLMIKICSSASLEANRLLPAVFVGPHKKNAQCF